MNWLEEFFGKKEEETKRVMYFDNEEYEMEREELEAEGWRVVHITREFVVTYERHKDDLR